MMQPPAGRFLDYVDGLDNMIEQARENMSRRLVLDHRNIAKRYREGDLKLMVNFVHHRGLWREMRASRCGVVNRRYPMRDTGDVWAVVQAAPFPPFSMRSDN
jgi:hypothetical protein